MADEGEFQAPAGGFITAGSKKAVRPSAAPFDPFADDAAPAPKPASGGALFQTAGARRPVRPKAPPAATARKAPKAAFDPFAEDDAPAAPSTKTPKPGRRPAYRTPATASTRGVPTPRSFDPFAGDDAPPATTTARPAAPRPTTIQKPKKKFQIPRTTPKAVAAPILRPHVFLEDAPATQPARPPPARPAPRGPPRPAPRPSSLDAAMSDFDLEAATRPRPGRVTPAAPAPAPALPPPPRAPAPAADAAAAAAAAKIARLEAENARLKAAAAARPPVPAPAPAPTPTAQAPARPPPAPMEAEAAAAPAPARPPPPPAPMEAEAPAPASTGIDYSRFDGIGDDDDDDEPPEIIHRPILPDNEPQPKPPPVPFDLSTQNVPALAKICERVGGKPVDEAKLARELERHAALWARDDAPDQLKIPTWTRPCSAQPEAGLIARIRKDPGGVVAPVLKVRKKEVRSTPLGPRVRLELGDGGNDAMAAHCKGDLTEKLRCCRPNALLRLVQWLVNDINGTKVIIVLQFDYVLQSVEDPSKFVAVPPPERTVQPEDEVKARVEANRAAALAIRDAKRRRQEAPPPSPSTEEAPLGIFRSSEEAKVVDAALGAALGAACLSHVYGPAGSGKSWLCATLAARALLRRKREAVVYLCATAARSRHTATHICNIAVTLGVDKDDAAGRTVVASFLNSEQMALALDNDAQWLARKRGVSLVVVDSAAAVCKDLPRHDRNAALRRILAAAKELARALNVAVVLVNEISHDFSDGARQGAYRPAMEQLYAFCGRTFRVAQHVQGRRSVALMGSSSSEEMRAPLAITSTGVADAGDLADDNSDRGFDDDSGDDDGDAMRDSD